MSQVYVDYITSEELEMKDLIESKIDILYDLSILKKRRRRYDMREYSVRELLSKCNSRYQMDMLLHDVIRGQMTLDTLLDEGKNFIKGAN